MADAIFLAQKKRGELDDDEYEEESDGHNTHRVSNSDYSFPYQFFYFDFLGEGFGSTGRI